MMAYLTGPDAWKELLSNDFNRGYLTGVALVLAISLVLLLFRIVLALIFRTRRARAIVVKADDGDIQISQNAISAAVGLLLKEFPELVLDSLKICRNGGRRYFLVIQCRFHSSARTFPDVAAQVKEMLFQGLERQFGIRDLRRIRIVLTDWDSPSGTPAAVPETLSGASSSDPVPLSDDADAAHDDAPESADKC